jgi:multidrug transporter EmrE-like cation transporter
MNAFFYTTVMASIDLIIMTLLKLKSISALTSPYILPLTMAIYSLQPLLFYKALSVKGMAILNVLWDATSSVLIALVGVFYFGEKISLINWLGIFLCTAGIVLVGI